MQPLELNALNTHKAQKAISFFSQKMPTFLTQESVQLFSCNMQRLLKISICLSLTIGIFMFPVRHNTTSLSRETLYNFTAASGHIELVMINPRKLRYINRCWHRALRASALRRSAWDALQPFETARICCKLARMYISRRAQISRDDLLLHLRWHGDFPIEEMTRSWEHTTPRDVADSFFRDAARKLKVTHAAEIQAFEDADNAFRAARAGFWMSTF
jgi:hypothetical protein